MGKKRKFKGVPASAQAETETCINPEEAEAARAEDPLSMMGMAMQDPQDTPTP